MRVYPTGTSAAFTADRTMVQNDPGYGGSGLPVHRPLLLLLAGGDRTRARVARCSVLLGLECWSAAVLWCLLGGATWGNCEPWFCLILGWICGHGEDILFSFFLGRGQQIQVGQHPKCGETKSSILEPVDPGITDRSGSSGPTILFIRFDAKKPGVPRCHGAMQDTCKSISCAGSSGLPSDCNDWGVEFQRLGNGSVCVCVCCVVVCFLRGTYVLEHSMSTTVTGTITGYMCLSVAKIAMPCI